MMIHLKPCFNIIVVSGFTMVVGFLLILFPLIKNQLLGYYLNRMEINNTSLILYDTTYQNFSF